MRTKVSKEKKLKYGVVLSYIAIFINIVVGLFLTGPIIASVGTVNYGIYSAASSLIHVFLIDFGLGTATTKYISEYKVTGDQNSINKLIKVVFATFIILSIILAFAFASVYVFLPKIYPKYTLDELHSLKIVFLMIAAYSVFSFPFTILNGILIAYENVLFSKIADIFAKLCFVASTLICIFFNLGLYTLTICFLINGLVSIVLKLIFMLLKVPVSFKVKVPFSEFKEIAKLTLSFSFWAAINTLSRTFLVSIMSSIMGGVAGPDEYLLFAVAAQIESYIAMLSTVFGTIFFPKVSQILLNNNFSKEKKYNDFELFFCNISRVQSIIMGLIVSGFLIFGQAFISLWIPDIDAKTVFLCAVILCVPSIFLYPLQMGEIAMATVGKIKYCAISNLTSLLIGIVSAFVLTRFLGSFGGAVAVFISYFFRGLFFVIVYKKHINFNFFKYIDKTYFRLIFPFVLTSMFAIFTYKMADINSWFSLIKPIIVYTSAYLIINLLFFKKDIKNKPQ